MLLGQYERTMDDKGRLAVPAELRPGLGSGAVLTRGFDNCLCIYPAARWEAFALAVDDLPDVSPEARDLARSVFGGAVPCDLDRQGRVAIPPFLREHAGLSADIVVVGVNIRAEIWDREAWLERQRRFEQTRPENAQALTLTSR